MSPVLASSKIGVDLNILLTREALHGHHLFSEMALELHIMQSECCAPQKQAHLQFRGFPKVV